VLEAHTGFFTSSRILATSPGDVTMKWETPAATDLRFGFEITMYIANR
jgi:coenzyme PQQ precursor peptide PqqA